MKREGRKGHERSRQTRLKCRISHASGFVTQTSPITRRRAAADCSVVGPGEQDRRPVCAVGELRQTHVHTRVRTDTYTQTHRQASTNRLTRTRKHRHRCWQQHRPTRMLARTHTCQYRHPSACSETQRRTRKYVNRNVRRHKATHANTDSRTLSQKRVQRHSDGDPHPHPQQRPGPSATPRLSRTSLGPCPVPRPAVR